MVCKFIKITSRNLQILGSKIFRMSNQVDHCKLDWWKRSDWVFHKLHWTIYGNKAKSRQIYHLSLWVWRWRYFDAAKGTHKPWIRWWWRFSVLRPYLLWPNQLPRKQKLLRIGENWCFWLFLSKYQACYWGAKYQHKVGGKNYRAMNWWWSFHTSISTRLQSILRLSESLFPSC